FFKPREPAFFLSFYFSFFSSRVFGFYCFSLRSFNVLFCCSLSCFYLSRCFCFYCFSFSFSCLLSCSNSRLSSFNFRLYRCNSFFSDSLGCFGYNSCWCNLSFSCHCRCRSRYDYSRNHCFKHVHISPFKEVGKKRLDHTFIKFKCFINRILLIDFSTEITKG